MCWAQLDQVDEKVFAALQAYFELPQNLPIRNQRRDADFTDVSVQHGRPELLAVILPVQNVQEVANEASQPIAENMVDYIALPD